MIAGNDQVGLSGNRAFQNPVVVIIPCDRVHGEIGNDDVRDFGDLLHLVSHSLVSPCQNGP